MRMFRSTGISIGEIVFWILSVSVCSLLMEQNSKCGLLEQAPTGDRRGSAKQKSRVDFEELILQLRSKNIAPGIRSGIPIFPEAFDFSEQRRVYDVVSVLVKNPEESWKHLVAKLDSDDYSFTMGYGVGAVNYSVGDVCRKIIQNNLEEPYREMIPTGRIMRNNMFLSQEISIALYGKERLRTWISNHSGESLGRLQESMIETVIEHLEGSELALELKNPFFERLRELQRGLGENTQAQIAKGFHPGRETWHYFSLKDFKSRGY